jgi:hypothetical protein
MHQQKLSLSGQKILNTNPRPEKPLEYLQTIINKKNIIDNSLTYHPIVFENNCKILNSKNVIKKATKTLLHSYKSGNITEEQFENILEFLISSQIESKITSLLNNKIDLFSYKISQLEDKFFRTIIE